MFGADSRIKYIAVLFVLLICAMSLSVVIPITAQGSFATNTPAGQANTEAVDTNPLLFATNTPSSSTSLAEPQDLLFNYALRFWLETDFVDFVFSQIAQLDADDTQAQLAVNVLLYEMTARFPDAPNDPAQRIQLIEAMINAPIGSLDMRSILFPFIQNTIDSTPNSDIIEAEGFTITLMPANLNGDANLDRLVHILYVQDEQIRYEEYLLAVANDNGSFTLLDTSYDSPTVPFNNINSVSVEYLADVDADTLDELVLRVDDGQASERFYIIEARNDRAFDLVDPDLELRVGRVINWAVEGDSRGAPDLVVFEEVAVSSYPDWNCNSQIEYTWRLDRNLYRRFLDLNERFTNIDSLGCTLAEADLFAIPAVEAIGIVENALLTYGFDDPSTNRALMTLSMLYILNGRLDDARNTAQSIITAGNDESWESQQARALITASSAAGNTALDICQALAIASEFPACDMNAVLGNILETLELSTEEDLITQLENMGLPILNIFTVSEIGRADRTVVQFALADTEWWGFYDGRQGTYLVEPAETPSSILTSPRPETELNAPQSAFDTLLLDDNPATTLTIIQNSLRNNPNLPIAPSTIYIQALANELTGRRDEARAGYYTVWEEYSDTIWALLASEHLELR